MHCRDTKYAVQLVLVNFLKGCEDLQNLTVREMIKCSEIDFVTECQKEWNIFYKKDVQC